MRIPLLQLKNITKSYGKKEVLKNITLDIFKGEIISFLGVNGAGKTTLVKLLCRIYDPTEGKILINGVDLKDVKTARERATKMKQGW